MRIEKVLQAREAVHTGAYDAALPDILDDDTALDRILADLANEPECGCEYCRRDRACGFYDDVED